MKYPGYRLACCGRTVIGNKRWGGLPIRFRVPPRVRGVRRHLWVPGGIKVLWHQKRQVRHAEPGFALAPGVVLDTVLLEAGKTSSCVKARSCLFLEFRVPSQGPGTGGRTQINLFARFEEREENCGERERERLRSR